jgi:hypothetical protein
MAWDDRSRPHLGFLMDRSRRVQGAKRGSFNSYVHLESLGRSMRMRLEALEEGE